MAREVQFVNKLSATDRYRHWHRAEKGRILKFTVQYETLIGEKWHPVVRHDTAHGFVHKDLMHPGKRQEKIFIKVKDFNAGLTRAEEDLRENWKIYKEFFMKEWQRHENTIK
jgi:hypothetical protein